jgi:hypothetical protein
MDFKYPPKTEGKNKMGWLINFDTAQSSYAFFRVLKVEDNLAKNRHHIIGFPVDVIDDGGAFNSEFINTTTTAVELICEAGCLVVAGAGSHSKSFTVYYLLPPTLARLPPSLLQASSMSEKRWQEFMNVAVKDSRSSQTIIQSMDSTIKKQEGLIRDAEFKGVAGAKDLAGFFIDDPEKKPRPEESSTEEKK